jgi:hypothetical protein
MALSFAAALAGLWLRRVRERWTPAAAARALEAARPSSRNVVITAEELLRHPERAAPSITSRVLHESAEITGATGRAQVVPLRRAAVAAIAALAAAATLVTGVWGRVSRSAVLAVQEAVARAGASVTGALTVSATIIPPDYTRETSRTVQTPSASRRCREPLALDHARWRKGGACASCEALTADESAAPRPSIATARSGYLAIERADW